MSHSGLDPNANAASDGTPSFAAHWIARPAAWLGGAVSALLILGAFAITIYSILMRYFLNAPLLWADEVTGWILVGLVMFGVAEAYRRGDHISIDVLTSRATGWVRSAVLVISDAAVFGFSIVLGYSSWHAISFARSFEVYTDGHIVIETWLLQTPLLIGAALLGLLALIRLADRFIGRRAG